MFNGKCAIRNEKREHNDVAHYGSIAVLPAIFGNTFTMHATTLDRYIPNATLIYH